MELSFKSKLKVFVTCIGGKKHGAIARWHFMSFSGTKRQFSLGEKAIARNSEVADEFKLVEKLYVGAFQFRDSNTAMWQIYQTVRGNEL